MIRAILSSAALLALCAGMFLNVASTAARGDDSTSKDRVFEMRTYYTLEGRLPALNKRFREHTIALFKKHGIESIAYYTPIDEKDGKSNKLVYILAYPSKEAATKSWEAFRNDPEWKKAQAASEADGKIVAKVESVFLNPTDYSAMK